MDGLEGVPSPDGTLGDVRPCRQTQHVDDGELLKPTRVARLSDGLPAFRFGSGA